MDASELARLLVVVSLVVLPAMAVTARFALKPIVDAILRLKEAGVLSSTPAITGEVQQLRVAVAELQREMDRLREAEEFHRALSTGAERAAPLPRPSQDAEP